MNLCVSIVVFLLVALSSNLVSCWIVPAHLSQHRAQISASPAEATNLRSPVRDWSLQALRWSTDDASSYFNTVSSDNTASIDVDLTTMSAHADEQLHPSGDSSDSASNHTTPIQPYEPDNAANLLGISPNDIEVVARNPLPLEEKPLAPPVPHKIRHSDFVDMFRGSANYIANHRNSMVIFHIPGTCIDNPNPTVFKDLMNDISLTWLLGLKIVIVVGCQHQVEKRIPNRKKHMGMVVTDSEGLRIVKEEAGYVRFEVERQLARALQGARSHHNLDGNVVSGNFYSAQPFGVLDGVDYQYSGFVRRFEREKILQCHANRDIVLLTTLGVSPTGEVFNVNSEYLAAYAGGVLGASKVIYFLEKDVELHHRVHGSKIPHLRSNDAKNLLLANDISTERNGFVVVGDSCPYGERELAMLVKMGWSMQALEKGVQRVHMVTPENGALLEELYTRDGAGTMISADVYDKIHQAKITDVSGIHELITPLILKGTLVDRPRAVLERDISQYHVYTRDGMIVACGQLKMYENGYAEIGCLVVHPAYRASGRGDAMLGYLERLCVLRGASVVFVLSTQTMEWFVERGFDEIPVEKLPPSRRASYNPSRASKIYMKKIENVRDLDASELFWNRQPCL